MTGVDHHQRAARIDRAMDLGQADDRFGRGQIDADHIVIAASGPAELAIDQHHCREHRERNHNQSEIQSHAAHRPLVSRRCRAAQSLVT
jgi:hypothetical protein